MRDGPQQVFFLGDELLDAVALARVKGLVFVVDFGLALLVGGEELGGVDGQAVDG